MAKKKPSTRRKQPELLLDDPRVEMSALNADDLARQVYADAVRDHGSLLTFTQSARLAGVSSVTIHRLVEAGRFTCVCAFGVRSLPYAEVLAYKRLKDSDDLAKGGRGLRAAPFKDEL